MSTLRNARSDSRYRHPIASSVPSIGQESAVARASGVFSPTQSEKTVAAFHTVYEAIMSGGRIDVDTIPGLTDGQRVAAINFSIDMHNAKRDLTRINGAYRKQTATAVGSGRAERFSRPTR